MLKNELIQYIRDHYSAEPEYIFREYPDIAVFRHGNNRKWFAVIMTVPSFKLGLTESADLDIVNFKADPFLISSLVQQRGFFRAYHMSKVHWITAALDGSADDEDILMLLDMSFDMTYTKTRAGKTK